MSPPWEKTHQAVVQPGLFVFSDRHHLNFVTSSFSVLKPQSPVALQKNEEMAGAGRPQWVVVYYPPLVLCSSHGAPLPPDRIDGVWLWPRQSVESLHWHMYVDLSRDYTLSDSSSFFSPLLNCSLRCFCPTVQVIPTLTDRRSLQHHVGLNCVSDRTCYPSHPSGCCFCEFTTRYELLLTSDCRARREQQVTGWKLLLPDGHTSSLYFFNSFPSQMNSYRFRTNTRSVCKLV